MLYIYSLLIFLVGTSHLQAVRVLRHIVYSSEIYEVSHKMYPDSLLYQSAFYRYRGLMEPCGSSYIYIYTYKCTHNCTHKYIYTTFREIKPLYQCLIKQSLRKPTILMINFINMVGFNYSVYLLRWHKYD